MSAIQAIQSNRLEKKQQRQKTNMLSWPQGSSENTLPQGDQWRRKDGFVNVEINLMMLMSCYTL